MMEAEAHLGLYISRYSVRFYQDVNVDSVLDQWAH